VKKIIFINIGKREKTLTYQHTCRSRAIVQEDRKRQSSNFPGVIKLDMPRKTSLWHNKLSKILKNWFVVIRKVINSCFNGKHTS